MEAKVKMSYFPTTTILTITTSSLPFLKNNDLTLQSSYAIDNFLRQIFHARSTDLSDDDGNHNYSYDYQHNHHNATYFFLTFFVIFFSTL